MVSIKKILVLPDAGPKNPFQYLLVNFLKENGYEVVLGKNRRFFSTYFSLQKHQPDAIFYDWIQSFIIGKNWVSTILKVLVFVFEIWYVKYIKRLNIFHTLHNIISHSQKAVKFEKVVYTFFLRKCDKIRVYDNSTKKKVIEYFGLDPDKIYIIQDLPYHFHYKNVVTRSDARYKLGILPGKFVYLFIGLIKPYKGLEELIIFFKNKCSNNEFLLIAGAPEKPGYKQKLLSLIGEGDNIKLIDKFIEDDEVQIYMNAADICIFPFKKIEHSGSVDLAMSFSKPIITLATPLLKNQLKHQKELLFENVDELAEIFIKVKNLDLQKIGELNFKKADKSNYKEFLDFFKDG